MQPQGMEANSHEKLEEARKDSPPEHQRESNPANTLVWDSGRTHFCCFIQAMNFVVICHSIHRKIR